MATDDLLQGVGNGAAIAAALTLVKIALDFTARRSERSIERDERRRRYERDAEERLERLLRDQADDAARRLGRRDDEIAAERRRRVALERECALLRQSYQALAARLGQADAAEALAPSSDS